MAMIASTPMIEGSGTGLVVMAEAGGGPPMPSVAMR